MFGIGIGELLLVLGIVLLLFGKRIPSLARSLGLSFSEFRKGTQGIDDADDSHSPPESARTNPPR
jgi:sec-independent protein translocase protein TatA